MNTDLAQSIGVLLMALVPVMVAVIKQLQQPGVTAAYSAPRNGAVLPGGNGHADLIARILKLEQIDASFSHLQDEYRAMNARLLLVEESAVEDRRTMNRYMQSTNDSLADIKTIVTAIKVATGEHPAIPPGATS